MALSLLLDCGPARVRLTGTDAESTAAIRDVSEAFGLPVSGPSPADLSISIQRASTLPLPPDGWPVATRYGSEVCLYRCDNVVAVHSPSAVSTVDLGSGTAEVLALHGDIREGTIEGHLVVCLTLLFRPAGLYPLHAAGLIAGSRGVLLVGPSDVGKSTLAYNLVRAGWSFLSDDTVLLHQRLGEPVEAVAFRRRFALDADAGDRRPELASEARPVIGDEDKWSVGVEALFPGQLAARCEPSLVVFPELTGDATSRIEPIAAGAAFIRLAAQAALREFDDAQTRPHHEMLSALLAQTTRVRLLAGRDLLDDPDAAATLLLSALRSDHS